MLNWMSRFFKSEEQPVELSTPRDLKVVFELRYKDLVVGHLILDDGNWQFFYSEEFKHQSKITPILDFPDTNKSYKATDLWPFFAHRIPGLGQPQVQEIIKNESLNPTNSAELLKRFGQKSITNPFELSLAG